MVDEGKAGARLTEEAEGAGKKSGPVVYLGFLPVLVLFALAMGAYWFMSTVRVYEPVLLLPILNTFVFLAACVIAYIAGRIYLISGSPTVLWIGGGVLTLALGALTAGWLIIPFGPNVSVTIFNVGALLASICHMGAVAANLGDRPGEADPGRRRRNVGIAFGAVVLGIALLALLTITGRMPPFFIHGQGPTVIRQNVAGWAIVLFIVSSLFTLNLFRHRRGPFLYWYSLALALLANAMLAFLLQPAVGCPIGWVGRSSYVLAAVYFLISVGAGLREARSRGLSPHQTILGLLDPRLHWQDIMATVSDAVVSYDHSGKMLLWNKAAERIFGYPEAEAVGQGVELILPDPKAIEASGATGGIAEIELRRRDGSRFNAEISVSSRKSASGGITTLVIRDVTGRKQAADETQRLLNVIQQERDKLTALVNSINDEVWFADPQGKFTLVNPSALREFGFDRAGEIDVAKLTGSLEVHRADGSLRDIEEAPPLRALKGEVITNLEEIIRAPSSGELRHRQVSAAPVRDADGKIIGSVSVARDITELKRAEAALQESEARFRGLFENMSEGMALHEIVYDDRQQAVDYRILAINPAFAVHTGQEPERVQGQMASVAYGTGEAPFLATYSQVAAGGPPVSFETFFPPLQRHFSISVTSPKPGQFVTIFQNITERKIAERKIQHLASFPQMNPQPVLEVDPGGRITYYNQAALEALGETGKAEDLKNFLPEDLPEIIAAVKQTGARNFQRQVVVNGAVFSENIFFAEQFNALRIYAADMTLHQQAEAALRDSEAHYRSLFNNMLNGYAYCRMHFDQDRPVDFTYLEVNEAFGELTGLQDVVGKKASEVIPGLRENDPQLFEIYGRVALTGIPERFETYSEALGMWFAISVYSPRPEHFVAVFDVITERKRAEAGLRRAKEEWERTFDAIPDLVAILDEHHRIVRVNQRMAEVLGAKPGDLKGRACYEVMHHSSAPIPICPHSKLLEDGREHVEELRELGLDLLVSASPLRDDQGRLIGSVHVARDITGRKQAEAALRDSETRFRTMANAIPQLAWTGRSDGHIFWYNQRWYDYTGTTPADMEGWGWQSVHDPEVLPRVLERWRTSLATGEPFDMVFPLRAADGQFRQFLTRVMPMKDANGQIIQWFGTNTDITERQQAEAALKLSYQRLDLLAETASQLLASVSPQRVVDAICPKVMEFLDCQVFFNFLVDEQEGRLRLNAYAGIPEEEASRIQWLDYGAAVCGCAARDGCRIVTEDILHTDDARTELVKSYGIQAYACHPLLVGGRILGTLSFGTRTRTSFTADELALMKAVADQVAIAMDRKLAEVALHRLNEELEQRVADRTAKLEELVAQLEEEVNDRQQAEHQAASLGRLYRLLSRVYEAIVHARDQEDLFRQACRIMMEEGDFLLCWIGRVDHEAGLVRAAAQFDLMEDYPQNITISLADVPEGRGPSGVAVREGRCDICLDIAGDPRMAPWRRQALARGFKSSAAFPLFVDGKVEGVLTLYSGQKGFFNKEEVEVLNSLAQDLSFAMESMHREAQRRQAEEEIRRLYEELEQRVKERTMELEFANRELEAFTYSASHDLKAPLRAIQGFSRMLLGEHLAGLDEEGVRMFNVIINNTQVMTRLIDDLLALSRLGRHQLRKANLNLAGMTRQVFARLREPEPEREVQLTVGDLPPAWGDPSLMHQVMMNLLDNALKYTKAEKTALVQVGGYCQDQETIYYVKDNGIGFDERYAGKLFGVFQRLHGGPEYEGTGVGLAIVQRIIQRHGGRVWAQGKTGEGATFYFSLPKMSDEV